VSLTLLCIDDEPNVLAVRKMLLESVGYRVLLAESGPIGLEILQREKVDTVILDFRMPEMTGAEVAQYIRETNSGIPISCSRPLSTLPPTNSKMLTLM